MKKFFQDILKENVFGRYKWSIGRVSMMTVLLTIITISIITAIKTFYGEDFNFEGIKAVLTSLVWVFGLLAGYVFSGKVNSMFNYNLNASNPNPEKDNEGEEVG